MGKNAHGFLEPSKRQNFSFNLANFFGPKVQRQRAAARRSAGRPPARPLARSAQPT